MGNKLREEQEKLDNKLQKKERFDEDEKRKLDETHNKERMEAEEIRERQ